MSRAIRIIGAAILAAAVWMEVVAPGLGVVSESSNRRRGFEASYVSLAINENSSRAFSSLDMRNPSPISNEDPGFNWYVKFGEAPSDAPSREQLERRAVDDPHAKNQTDGFGGYSVVLTGPVATAIHGCDEDVRILRQLTFDDLTETEKRSVEAHAELSPPAARKMLFTVLQATVVVWDGRPSALDDYDESEKLLSGWFGYIGCSVNRASLTPTAGFERRLAFPAAAGAMAGRSGGAIAPQISLRRTIRANEEPEFSVETAEAQGEAFLDRRRLQIIDHDTSGVNQAPAVSLAAAEAAFDDVQSAFRRDLTVFVAGVGLGIVTSLLLWVAKSLWHLGFDRIRRREAS